MSPRSEAIESVCFGTQNIPLWQQKGMFWVPEQRLVDQANVICRNSWMTELEIEELERKVTGSDSVIVEEARRVGALLVIFPAKR